MAWPPVDAAARAQAERRRPERLPMRAVPWWSVHAPAIQPEPVAVAMVQLLRARLLPSPVPSAPVPGVLSANAARSGLSAAPLVWPWPRVVARQLWGLPLSSQSGTPLFSRLLSLVQRVPSRLSHPAEVGGQSTVFSAPLGFRLENATLSRLYWHTFEWKASGQRDYGRQQRQSEEGSGTRQRPQSTSGDSIGSLKHKAVSREKV